MQITADMNTYLDMEMDMKGHGNVDIDVAVDLNCFIPE